MLPHPPTGAVESITSYAFLTAACQHHPEYNLYVLQTARLQDENPWKQGLKRSDAARERHNLTIADSTPIQPPYNNPLLPSLPPPAAGQPLPLIQQESWRIDTEVGQENPDVLRPGRVHRQLVLQYVVG